MPQQDLQLAPQTDGRNGRNTADPWRVGVAQLQTMQVPAAFPPAAWRQLQLDAVELRRVNVPNAACTRISVVNTTSRSAL